MIPFKYGAVVSGEDFCGREDLIHQFKEFMSSSQNILVQGERRIGKTSLVYETVRRLKSHRALFVDFMEVKTSHEFCRRIIKSMISLEAKGSLLNQVFKRLSSLRPQISIDPLTSLPTIALDPAVKLSPDSLEEVFDLIYDLNKKKNLVVVFDEFQDILNLKDTNEMQAILRSKIQYHNDISYFFTGSIRKKMDQIFTDSESPLFKSAIPITVDSLPKKEFSVFLQKKFEQGDRTVGDDVLDRVFVITDGISGDIQQLCEALWGVSDPGELLTESHLQQAFKLIFARESKSYELIISESTAVQRKCLLGLAKLGGLAPMSTAFLLGAGVAQPSSVKKSLERLIARKIVFKSEKDYRFTNPFFKAWLNFKNL